MATAQRVAQDTKRIVEFVTQEVVSFVPQPDRILLELSIEEAETLAILAHQTGGDPQGRRGDMTNIGQALRAANITYSGVPQDDRDPFVGRVQYHPDLLTGVWFSSTRTRVGLPFSNWETPLSPGQDVPENNAKAAVPTAATTCGGTRWGTRHQTPRDPNYC